MSISVVDRCQGTTACHNVINCLQAYTAQAASGTVVFDAECCVHNTKSEELDLKQQQPVPQLQQEDLMTSAICRSLSCPKVVSLYTKRTIARVEMFCICLRPLLEDTMRQDGPTSMHSL